MQSNIVERIYICIYLYFVFNSYYMLLQSNFWQQGNQKELDFREKGHYQANKRTNSFSQRLEKCQKVVQSATVLTMTA